MARIALDSLGRPRALPWPQVSSLVPVYRLVGTYQLAATSRTTTGRPVPPYYAVIVHDARGSRVHVEPVCGALGASGDTLRSWIPARLLLTPLDRLELDITGLGPIAPVDAPSPPSQG